MKGVELRKFSYQELGEKLDEAKAELFNLRFQLATNQLDNTTRLRGVRREIARIKSIRREQELEAYYREQDQHS